MVSAQSLKDINKEDKLKTRSEQTSLLHKNGITGDAIIKTVSRAPSSPTTLTLTAEMSAAEC